jgi:hypothetical protein
MDASQSRPHRQRRAHVLTRAHTWQLESHTQFVYILSNFDDRDHEIKIIKNRWVWIYSRDWVHISIETCKFENERTYMSKNLSWFPFPWLVLNETKFDLFIQLLDRIQSNTRICYQQALYGLLYAYLYWYLCVGGWIVLHGNGVIGLWHHQIGWVGIQSITFVLSGV